jgi:predicted RNase H-like nuclease (RuvC/YqgF family)
MQTNRRLKTPQDLDKRIGSLERRVDQLAADVRQLVGHLTQLDQLRQEVANLKLELEERTEFGRS